MTLNYPPGAALDKRAPFNNEDDNSELEGCLYAPISAVLDGDKVRFCFGDTDLTKEVINYFTTEEVRRIKDALTGQKVEEEWNYEFEAFI